MPVQIHLPSLSQSSRNGISAARAGRPRIDDFHTNIHELMSRRRRNVPYYTRDNMEGQRSHANIATSAISKNPTSEGLVFIRSTGAEAFPRDHIP